MELGVVRCRLTSFISPKDFKLAFESRFPGEGWSWGLAVIPSLQMAQDYTQRLGRGSGPAPLPVVRLYSFLAAA